ncbi:hypothetical protein CC1G_15269 [Coprinopsis cinerea okayama7|uniref:Uncharacterized protein n=1 Tax=Coprinopsis cinerea (strain Okayama-7 / 130 / ATCC MYA-4618 / FGSC 9003) TaxID=240176 RepID=D6RPW8_COPC7|nr:hypothetical protein CC1G_15269 [Coprinopsis cinerea okayama7\|eukprot:XP_002910361.1 hypothetical protein CC1G_15269 [Coprinopsis cinerea okayama7\
MPSEKYTVAGPKNHYILLSIEPPTNDALSVRKAIADSLAESFGETSSAIPVDVMSIAENGEEMVVRAHIEWGDVGCTEDPGLCDYIF